MGGYPFADLSTRIRTAFILIPIFLFVLYLGSWILWIVALMATLQALNEVQLMVGGKRPLPLRVIFWLYLIVAFCLWWSKSTTYLILITTLIPLSFFIFYPLLRAYGLDFFFGSVSITTIFILTSVGISVMFLREQGFFVALFLFVTLWTSDSAALFGGRLWGKHKFPTFISSHKSYEGFVSGLMGAIFPGILAYILFPSWYPSFWLYIGAALLISFTGQIGDLSESALKREVGVKDSSNLFPGHGGVLDRIDSVIGSSLFFALYHFFLRST